MSGVSDLDKIFTFLQLELTEDGLEFFFNVKNRFAADSGKPMKGGIYGR